MGGFSVKADNRRKLERHLMAIWDCCLPLDPLPLDGSPAQPQGPFALKVEAFATDMHQWLASALIEGWGDLSDRAKVMLVLRAAYRSYKEETMSLDSFFASLTKARDWWLTRPVQTYEAAISFDVQDIPPPIDGITVLGLRLDGKSLASAFGTDQADDFVNQARRHFDDRGIQTLQACPFLWATVEARDEDEALESVAESYEVVRYSLNLAREYSRKTTTIGGTYAVALVTEPAVYGCKGPDSVLRVWRGFSPPDFNRRAVEERTTKNALQTLGLLRQRPRKNASARRLLQALRVAGEALDRVRLSDQLLGLWTSLEILSNSPRGQTDDVCRRIVNLWPDGPGSTVAEILDATKSLRNQWVHSGDFDPHFQVPVSEMRYLTAFAIHRYATLSQTLKSSSDFEYLFSNMSKSIKQRKRSMELNGFIDGLHEAVKAP